MKQYTDIVVLLDRSGSMSSIKESMERAFNTFIKEHKAVPSTKLTLIQFDDHNPQQVVYQGVPIGSAEKLTLKPRGNTPLLDAFCEAIDKTGERLSEMSEADRPDQVLFVVITDGQENASSKYRRADVSKRVTNQRENYKWQFIYLGANQDAISEAASFGIPLQWAMTYTHSPATAGSAMRSVMSNTVAYASASAATRSKSVPEFTSTQRKEAETTNGGTI